MYGINKIALHYFNDGKGSVPAHRHLNPDGSLGGWVAETASVAPTCFVGPSAQVFGTAKVCGDAQICDEALVFDFAEVHGAAKILGNAMICDRAKIIDTAKVFGNAQVFDNAQIYDNAEVFDDADVFGDAQVYGNANVCGNAMVSDKAKVYGNAYLSGVAQAYEKVKVDGSGWSWEEEKPPALTEQRRLARAILERVIEAPDALDMEVFHSECGTSHCIAGWVQVLRAASVGIDHNDDGRAYECGVRFLPAMAPFFFEDRDLALKELQKLAAG